MIKPATKLKEILSTCRGAFYLTAFFSCIVNILMLTVPLYMLQLFDRVIASQSYDTLIYLTFIAILALLIMSLLDVVRGRILIRVGRWIDERLSPLALKNSLDNKLLGGNYGKQCLSDIGALRNFLAGASIFAFFDAPWIFIYLLFIYLLSIPLGILATLGAIILFILALINETFSRESTQKANEITNANQQRLEDVMNNAENTQAMGILPTIIQQWSNTQTQALEENTKASDQSGLVVATSKFIRLVLQILMLGIGAYFVIKGELTAGAMLASSIILGRALAPVEQAIGAWKTFLNTYHAYQRLNDYFETPATRIESMTLPKPEGTLTVENLTFAPTKNTPPILQGIQFTLPAGHMLAIIGPTGAGKSTLARLIVGIWPPSFGSIRLDGADIYHWKQDDIGAHIGYLSQQISLFNDSVKNNIVRLGTPNEADIIAATKLLNIHQLILKLPQGYNTPTNGYQLPLGLKQRIGLARAFYGNPSLIVLDEPETHLDQDGLLSLKQAIQHAKANKQSVVFITQRPDLAKLADKIMIMNQGKIQALGPAPQIMQQWQGSSHE